MSEDNFSESMLDMSVFETSKHLESIENQILASEESGCCAEESINEIFRCIHTIKGSSAMMMFDPITSLAHEVEDVFYLLRDRKPAGVDYAELSDLVLKSVDFFKTELGKIRNGEQPVTQAAELTSRIQAFLGELRQKCSPCAAGAPAEEPAQKYYIPPKPPAAGGRNHFRATLRFDDDCGMENVRAFGVMRNASEYAQNIRSVPEKVLENDESSALIRRQGLVLFFDADKTEKEVRGLLGQTLFLSRLEVEQLPQEKQERAPAAPASLRLPAQPVQKPQTAESPERAGKGGDLSAGGSSIISVAVAKLDVLMDMMGEMIISESMVVMNPEIQKLQIESFQKSSEQLHKITMELQDAIMSIRMVPVVTVFQKMHRVVRDMNKKLNKNVALKIVGGETEMDKNLIEHISDPLMHLVRNSVDHGIGTPQEREALHKAPNGTVTLEARNAGSDVLILVSDDGKGFDKDRILQKAKERNLLKKPASEMSDEEIYKLVLQPGFSTNENVTEFSGRGVGMDVVVKNIEALGGTVTLASAQGAGSTVTLKIPLTTTIITGMNIRVGKNLYTIPITSIRESFIPDSGNIFTDPDGNEIIMIRGICYPILRLHRVFGVEAGAAEFGQGVFILVEQESTRFCVFADKVIGQQEVVVKTLPRIVAQSRRLKSFSGCTLLGDGNISLIIDVAELSKFGFAKRNAKE